jgi:hypothetical protein
MSKEIISNIVKQYKDSSREFWLNYLLDFVLIVTLYVIGVCMNAYVEPTERYFDINDPSLQYPFKVCNYLKMDNRLLTKQIVLQLKTFNAYAILCHLFQIVFSLTKLLG